LLRIWLVASGLFIAGFVFVFVPEIRSEFKSAALQEHVRMLVPVPCSSEAIRGAAGVDYETDREDQHGPWETYGGKSVPLCWYQVPKFRSFYPQYKDLTDDDLLKRSQEKVGIKTSESATPWRMVAWVASLAIGVPLAALIVGAALFWAVIGFRRQ
jgi:hypothetical protein